MHKTFSNNYFKEPKIQKLKNRRKELKMNHEISKRPSHTRTDFYLEKAKMRSHADTGIL